MAVRQYNRMNTRVLVFLATVAARPPVVGAQHAAPLQSPVGHALTPRDSAAHALNRLAYGPRPGEIERVARAGVVRWIDAQLTPDKIDDHIVARRGRGRSASAWATPPPTNPTTVPSR